MKKDTDYCSECCREFVSSEGCDCDSSGSSGCSGADARQADKACFATTEDGRPIDISPEGNLVVREAAVSDRSSDGLLPCPFCGGDVSMVMWGYSKAGPFDVSIECNCCRISFKHAWGDHKTAWNKRATKSPIETA
jgi:hypothetical protein